MKEESGRTQIEMEANSKPYLFKRFIADGFDIVLVFALFMALTALIMKTPLAGAYRAHVERATEIAQECLESFGGDAEAASEALRENGEYRDEVFAANLRGYILKGLAILLSEGAVLLAFPLADKDRSTPGKRMTGVMLFSETRRGKASGLQIFLRFLFVFFFDSLGLYLFTGIYTFLLVPVLRLTEMLITRDNRTVLDLMTGLKVIEKLSYDGIN